MGLREVVLLIKAGAEGREAEGTNIREEGSISERPGERMKLDTPH